MPSTNPDISEAQVRADEPQPKRRKVRKGTQSCWECRRRKIRCTPSTAEDAACDNCRRRGTTCTSQDFPDSSAPAASGGLTEGRLIQIEALFEQLVERLDPNRPPNPPSDLLSHQTRNVPREFLSADLHSALGNIDCEGLIPSSFVDNETPHNREVQPNLTSTTNDGHSPLHTQPATCSSLAQDVQRLDKHDGLSRDLLVVWPSQNDLDQILSLPSRALGLFHGMTRVLSSCFLAHRQPSLREVLESPPPGSHPVLAARKLLCLGTYLQCIFSNSAENLEDVGERCLHIMSRAVQTATSLVNSDDELVGCIEGIECIILESIYRCNSGELRRSWIAARRALAVAEILGLDRVGTFKQPKSRDLEARTSVNLVKMWFHLVHLDRYLSLVLGLPQGCAENSFATTEALAHCTPTECLERLDCVAAGRVLRRNRTNLHDLSETKEIDELLQKASASTPSQWWLTSNIILNADDDAKADSETSRLLHQFTHFNLVVQLHLPYLLSFPTDTKYDYNRITAVNASRELLMRFILFRSSNRAVFFGHGLELFALISSAVLCLAHIDARKQRENSVFSFFKHQRPGDFGLMESTLESLDHIARSRTDSTASNFANILRGLLAIEADSTDSRSDISVLLLASDDEPGYGGKVNEEGNVVTLYIPHLGTIRIERHGTTRPALAVPRTIEEEIQVPPVAEAFRFDPLVSWCLPQIPQQQVLSPTNEISLDFQLENPKSMDRTAEWPLQGVETDFFDFHLDPATPTDISRGANPG